HALVCRICCSNYRGHLRFCLSSYLVRCAPHVLCDQARSSQAFFLPHMQDHHKIINNAQYWKHIDALNHSSNLEAYKKYERPREISISEIPANHATSRTISYITALSVEYESRGDLKIFLGAGYYEIWNKNFRGSSSGDPNVVLVSESDATIRATGSENLKRTPTGQLSRVSGDSIGGQEKSGEKVMVRVSSFVHGDR
ncbi:hypothetical protein BC938DRAFT_483870, partial [Jimgerdemannia flammicorona]